ncbi:MAG: tail fiber protein [Chitinophagaceae bacterium]
MDPFVAEVRIFGFNFPPKGWATCDGQLLPISQNTALFSLLGTYYGGDGRTNFGLPNLQGSAALHAGESSGSGLTQRFVGETGGSQTVTLIASELPSHTHVANAKTGGNTASPTGLNWGNPGGRPAPNFFANAIGSPQNMSPQALSLAGGSLPHNNLMPYVTLNFCIALQGVYPPRS